MSRQERLQAWKEAQHEKALPVFMDTVAEIRERLEELSCYFEDFMETDPDEITFAHVGSAEFYLEKLTELTDSAFKRGEYA